MQNTISAYIYIYICVYINTYIYIYYNNDNNINNFNNDNNNIHLTAFDSILNNDIGSLLTFNSIQKRSDALKMQLYDTPELRTN